MLVFVDVCTIACEWKSPVSHTSCILMWWCSTRVVLDTCRENKNNMALERYCLATAGSDVFYCDAMIPCEQRAAYHDAGSWKQFFWVASLPKRASHFAFHTKASWRARRCCTLPLIYYSVFPSLMPEYLKAAILCRYGSSSRLRPLDGTLCHTPTRTAIYAHLCILWMGIMIFSLS